MANSKLVSYVWNGSKANCNVRDHAIDTITIHHMAGNGTCEGCCRTLAYKSEPGSVNYCIDSNGTIGVMIDEDMRAWTSSNRANDMRAVTMEVANDKPSDAGGWHVSDKALASVINLCADICKRHGKKKMIWCGSLTATEARKFAADEMRMTIHKWFAWTGCPGAYLESKMQYIADEVTKRLNPAPAPTTFTGRVRATHGCYTYNSKKDGTPIVNGFYKKGSQWTVEKVEVYAGQKWGKIKDSSNWLLMTDVTTTTKSASNFRVRSTQNCYTYNSNKNGMPAVNGAYKKGSQWTVEKVITYAGQTWGKIKNSDKWLRIADVEKM